MSVSLFGIEIVVILEFLNARSPRVCSCEASWLLPRVTERKQYSEPPLTWHSANAHMPIDSTLSGMLTSVSEVPSKALSPMVWRCDSVRLVPKATLPSVS